MMMIEAIVKDANCVGVAQSDLAIQFNASFRDNERAFQDCFDSGKVEPGKLFVFQREQADGPRFVFNLPTKIHWKADAKKLPFEKGSMRSSTLRFSIALTY